MSCINTGNTAYFYVSIMYICYHVNKIMAFSPKTENTRRKKGASFSRHRNACNYSHIFP